MEITKELKKIAKGISVLYVEDEDLIRKEVNNFLVKFFDTIETACNGEEGLEKFKQKKYDLVITDIRMPKLNGLQMTNEIKKLDKKTKIIITSAYDDKKLLLNAIEIDVEHYIVKPFDYSNFIVTLYKTVDLISLEKKIENFNKHMQVILDFQENIVFTIKNEKITFANKKFLNFFQLSSTRELYENNINIADFFVKDEKYYYPSNKDNWSEDFSKNNEHISLIKILDKKTNIPKIFILKIGFLEEFDETIATLTDISDFLEHTIDKTTNEEASCFFFDQNNITKFFTFLKNEIDRSKRHSLPLSVIEFKISTNETAQEAIDKAIKLTSDELDIMDFLLRAGDKKFIIVKIDTDLEKANELAKKLNSALKKECGLECDFGIAGLDHRENLQNLLARAEKLVQYAKNTVGINIKSDYFSAITPNFIQQEKQLIFNKLSNIEKTKKIVKLIYFHHGMKIVKTVKIHSVNPKEEKVILLFIDKQHESIGADNQAFLEIDEYISEIGGNIESESLHDGFTTLKNLNFAKISPLKREYIRIGADKDIPVKLHMDNEDIIGSVLDISLKSIAIELSSIKNLALGKIVNVNFSLLIDQKNENLDISSEIYKIEKKGKAYIVVLLFAPSREIKHTITSYITKRQQAILSQINKSSSL